MSPVIRGFSRPHRGDGGRTSDHLSALSLHFAPELYADLQLRMCIPLFRFTRMGDLIDPIVWLAVGPARGTFAVTSSHDNRSARKKQFASTGLGALDVMWLFSAPEQPF